MIVIIIVLSSFGMTINTWVEKIIHKLAYYQAYFDHLHKYLRHICVYTDACINQKVSVSRTYFAFGHSAEKSLMLPLLTFKCVECKFRCVFFYLFSLPRYKIKIKEKLVYLKLIIYDIDNYTN